MSTTHYTEEEAVQFRIANALERIADALEGRPLEEKSPERGTLTFQSDGNVIVGFPVQTTQSAMHEVQKMMEDWINAEAKWSLGLPFPVDVIDQREKVEA